MELSIARKCSKAPISDSKADKCETLSSYGTVNVFQLSSHMNT